MVRNFARNWRLGDIRHGSPGCEIAFSSTCDVLLLRELPRALSNRQQGQAKPLGQTPTKPSQHSSGIAPLSFGISAQDGTYIAGFRLDELSHSVI
jgi:hypothetical protein